MLDSSLINLSPEAIPANFDLMVPNMQSEYQRSMRNPPTVSAVNGGAGA